MKQIEKMSERGRINTLRNIEKFLGKELRAKVESIAMTCEPFILERTMLKIREKFRPHVFIPLFERVQKCDKCGQYQPIEGGVTTAEDLWVCSSCTQHLSECRACNQVFLNEQFDVMCSDCEMSHFVCDECHGVFDENEDNSEYIDGNTYCGSCYDRLTYSCDSCGTRVLHDDTVEVGSGTICESCYSSGNYDGSYVIRNYSWSPRFQDYGKERRFGIELEFEGNKGTAKSMCDLSSNIYCKEDGSLDNGYEVVTMPLLFADAVKLGMQIGEKAKSEGMKGDNSTCGIHVHVSRNGIKRQDKTIGKLLLLFTQFDEKISKFARRSSERWAKISKKNKEGYKADLDRFICEERSDRYRAINLCNGDTIEFRIFKGTNNPKSIAAIIQFCNAFIDFAEEVDVDEIENLEWSDIFRSKLDDPAYKCMFEAMNKRNIPVLPIQDGTIKQQNIVAEELEEIIDIAITESDE